MTPDDLLDRLRTQRGEFDDRVSAIPLDRLDEPVPGGSHSPKQIVAHVTAYEELIVARLRAARNGEMTDFDRDRVGWEEFNERVWAEAASADAAEVLTRSAEVFADLIAEVGELTEAELTQTTGVTASIDPAWLQGRTLAAVIGVDGFEHYPMHFGALDAASGR